MAKKIEVTYYDNLNDDFDYYKKLYQECNDFTDEEMEEVLDNDIWEYIGEEHNFELKDFFTKLKYSNHANMPCVITGSIGLWTGKHKIKPVACDDIESAINKCANKVDYVIIKQVNGHLEVTGVHHDGCNTFEIHLLNDKGVCAMENINNGCGEANLECHCYHKSLNGYLF